MILQLTCHNPQERLDVFGEHEGGRCGCLGVYFTGVSRKDGILFLIPDFCLLIEFSQYRLGR